MSSQDHEAHSAQPTNEVGDGVSTVVIVVHDGTSPRRSGEVMRWVRTLVPAALILVLSAPIAPAPTDDVVTVNVDDVDAGPLSVAAALARPRGARD